MRHFRSEFAFNKYKPHFSYQKKFLMFFKRRGARDAKISQKANKYRGNPFKREKRKSPILRIVKFILLAGLLILWIWLMFFNPYFKIKNITFSGLRNIPQDEINGFLLKEFFERGAIIPNDNFFFVKTDKIEKKLKENFPIENIKVEKMLPDKLNILVEEKISSLIYDNGSKYYLLDLKGNIIKFIKEVSTATLQAFPFSSSTTSSLIHIPDFLDLEKSVGYYPILFDNTTSTGVINEIKFELSEELILSIVKWYNLLAKDEQGIGRSLYFRLDDINTGLIAKNASKPDILIDPFKDASAQLNNLEIILKNEKPRQYVDLRFGERVNWK